MDEVLASDDLLFHLFSNSFRRLDPCWCFPHRTAAASTRPASPALHVLVLLRLRLVCRKWRALICEVSERPHAAVDLSGCVPPAWLPPSTLSAVHSLLLADAAPRTLSLLQRSELSSLTALSLRGSRALTDSSIAQLLRAARPSLVTLSLSSCVSDEYKETFAVLRCGGQPLLRELDLSCCAIGEIQTFSSLSRLDQLRRLDLSDNRLLDRACGAWAMSTVFSRLDELALDACGLGDRGLAQWLAYASQLQTLSLADCRPSVAGLRMIGRLAPALTWLELSDSEVLDDHEHEGASEEEVSLDGAAADALSALPPTLRTLRVLRCASWLSHHAVWNLEQQGCAVVHDLPAAAGSLASSCSFAAATTAPRDKHGGAEGTTGTTDAAVDDWEDLLSETCDAVSALKLPEGAPRPSHAPPRADADYESLYFSSGAAGSARRERPESIFRVSLGKAGTGSWRAR